jgi:hypothetical protein
VGNGGSSNFITSINSTNGWSATVSDASWIGVDRSTCYADDKCNFNIILQPNTGSSPRTGTVTLRGQKNPPFVKVITITQPGTGNATILAAGCYTLKAKHSNKFLQVADANNGTRIRQQDGNGSTNQIFKLEVVDGSLYRIISQFSNKVMDAANAGTSNGTLINQYDWNNVAQQKWRLEAYGDGTYKLVPSYTNALTTDVEGASLDNGAGLHLWGQYGGDSQRFYVQTSGCTGGSTPPAASLSGCYVIRSVQSNQLMEAIAGNTVEQRGANGSNSQIWKAETAATNQYRFITQNGSGLAMSVNALNNGELMRLTSSSADNRQMWMIQDNGSGAYRISGSNNATWDMRNYGSDPQLQLYGTTSESFQNYRLFRFESVGCPGGTTTPPTNPTSGNPSGGSYDGYLDGANCDNSWGGSTIVTVRMPPSPSNCW